MASMRGLATGIGSLPYKNAAEALDLVFSCCPEIPFWPQLPRRDPRESMVAQFSENLPCLTFTGEGLIFEPRDSDRKLELFYDRLIAGDLEYFRISEAYAAGFWAFLSRLERVDTSGIRFLKCHVTGPFTFAASIRNEKGESLLHDHVFMQVITKGLAMKAVWQIKRLKVFGKPVIVFIDEPYLGTFGSAYTAVNREDVLAVLGEFTSALEGEGATAGVHCCGNTDWSMFCDVPGIAIINFDAFGFLERLLLYASAIDGFLKRGGTLCWGIVPTQGEIPGLDREQMLRKVNAGIKGFRDKGVDGRLLEDKLMISPACGLGSLDPPAAKGIFGLLKDLSAALRQG